MKVTRQKIEAPGPISYLVKNGNVMRSIIYFKRQKTENERISDGGKLYNIFWAVIIKAWTPESFEVCKKIGCYYQYWFHIAKEKGGLKEMEDNLELLKIYSIKYTLNI